MTTDWPCYHRVLRLVAAAETAGRRGLGAPGGNGDLYIELARIAHAAGHAERIKLIRQRYELALALDRDVIPSSDSRVITCFDELLQRPRTGR